MFEQEQKQYLKEQLETQKQMVENHEEGAEELLAQTEKSLDEINAKIASKFVFDNLGENAMKSLSDGIASGKEKDLSSELERVAVGVGVKLEKASDGSYKVGETTVKELANGIKSKKITAEEASQTIASAIYNTCASEQNLNAAKNSGESLGSSLLIGIFAGMKAATDVVEQAEETEIREMLESNALAELEKYKNVVNVDIKIVNTGKYVYTKDYNLGDIITVRIDSLGIEETRQIIEVSEVWKANKHEVYIELGESRQTTIDKTKRTIAQGSISKIEK